MRKKPCIRTNKNNKPAPHGMGRQGLFVSALLNPELKQIELLMEPGLKRDSAS